VEKGQKKGLKIWWWQGVHPKKKRAERREKKQFTNKKKNNYWGRKGRERLRVRNGGRKRKLKLGLQRDKSVHNEKISFAGQKKGFTKLRKEKKPSMKSKSGATWGGGWKGKKGSGNKWRVSKKKGKEERGHQN